ncbi:hypothetical protein [Dapis sp. BLCC M172]|uniref:hypothetical protein n=1 Tax=Dapis sp. BLCC M172 TaxID=2975281 RepID=UPI003CF508C9
MTDKDFSILGLKYLGFQLLMHGSRKIKKSAFLPRVGQKNYSPIPLLPRSPTPYKRLFQQTLIIK